jgi:hypothetical protein
MKPYDRITVRSSDLVITKPDKVVTTLEEALKGVVIEWEN